MPIYHQRPPRVAARLVIATCSLFVTTTTAPSSGADPPASVSGVSPDGVRWHAGLDSGVGLEAAGFAASVGFLGQLGYEVTVPGQGDPSHGFTVPKARPNLRFSAFDGLVTAFVQPELVGTPSLLDLQIGIHPLPELQLELGQFITPHSRAFMTPVPKLQLPDFGVVEGEFRAGRDVGVAVHGLVCDGELEYAAGLFDGNGLQGRFGAGYMGMGRLVVNPFGPVPYDETLPLVEPDGPLRLAIGWNGYGRIRDRPDLPQQRDLVVGPEVFLVYQGFTLLAEGYRRHRKEAGVITEAWGGYAQTGYFVLPRLLEIAARVGALDRSLDAPGGTQAVYEGAFNIYPAKNHLKVQLRYAHTRGDAPAPDVEHRVTAQMQLWL